MPPAVSRSSDDDLQAAFRRLDAAPDDVSAKVAVARLLKRAIDPLGPEHIARLHALLTDPDIDPRFIARPAWALLTAQGSLSGDAAADARWLEQNAFARALIEETWVDTREVEIALTRVRRWLLLNGLSDAFPLSVAALGRQAEHNGGAWLFDEDERVLLAEPDSAALRPAYLPQRPQPLEPPGFASPVTRAVANQYDAWPFPSWRRAMAGTGESLSSFISALSPLAPKTLPDDARLLVAGCGTGAEPVAWARRFPRLHITAIDISRTALDVAAARAEEAGVENIRFEWLDLHEAGRLGATFDLITASGVLHHLPDPEAGWAAIAGLLRPGGVMHVMLYSRVGRLMVRAAQARILDLAKKPIDDDLLRAIRRRLMDMPLRGPANSRNFYHLGGVYDLLVHAHEDTFDIPRIRQATEALGLDLLCFKIAASRRDRYRALFPEDPHFRNMESMAAFERNDLPPSGKMHDFWLMKPIRDNQPRALIDDAHVHSRASPVR